MIGSIIGGVLNVGGAAFGAIAGKRSADKQKKMIDAQEAKNQRWYDRNYNQNVTQRADAQALIGKTRELLQERAQRAAATNTVMGGTDEALALEKEAANKTVSDTIQGIQASADQRKDAIEQQYQQKQDTIADMRFNKEQNKAQQMQAAASQMSSAGKDIMSSAAAAASDKAKVAAAAAAGASGVTGSILDKK